MNLFFRKYGAGFPIIFLHGLFGMSDYWIPIAEAFSKEYSVYLPDLRNHGHSPHSENMSYESMTADLVGFCRQQNLDRFHLVGHSMGGRLAMNFAASFAERVSKLAVIDIGTSRYVPKHFSEFLLALNQFDLNAVSSRKEASSKLQQILSDDKWIQLLLKNLYCNKTKNWQWRFNFQAISNNANNILEPIITSEPIQAPALFIYGDNSDYVKESDLVAIREQFPNSKSTSVPNASHWLHADNPELFIRELRLFFQE